MMKDQQDALNSLYPKNAIRARREAAGLTQAELGAMVWVAPSTVYNWERGIMPRTRHINKLAQVFGCDHETLRRELERGKDNAN